ncbi:hypothetical protein Scep_019267 [Stephania cephalantha]|uniref:Uncharacterized protein n=1 Tax=Stephania cephalantha TaxID=152367 RepID=A0AAP0IAI4_9MAGN
MYYALFSCEIGPRCRIEKNGKELGYFLRFLVKLGYSGFNLGLKYKEVIMNLIEKNGKLLTRAVAY